MSNNIDPTTHFSTSEPVDKQVEDKAPLSRRCFMQSTGSMLLAAGAASQVAASNIVTGNTDAVPVGAGLPVVGKSKAAEPSVAGMEARYERAKFMWRIFLGQEKVTRNTTVYPYWIGDSDSFWYVRETKSAKLYRLVDAKRTNNNSAFDHKALAKTLSVASGKDVDAGNLPLGDLDIKLSPRQVSFTAFGKQWRYDEKTKTCHSQGEHHPDRKISPDGKNAVFTRDHNLWLVDLNSGKERALTTDGGRHYSYATTPSVYGRQERITLEVLWSADSERIFTLVRDSTKVKPELLIRYVPTDGTFRPQPTDPERRVAFPQDNSPEVTRFLSINVDTGKATMADYRPTFYFYPAYVGPFSGNRAWWNHDNRKAYYIDLDLDGKTGRLLEFDTYTGKTKVLIEEAAEHGFAFTPGTHVKPLLMHLPDTNEFIWSSRRSGWTHLYLYDLGTGKLKKQITKGKWMVRNILHLDKERGEFLIQTAGRVQGRNPYYCDICRVSMDTGKITTLLSTDHEYTVLDQNSRIGGFFNARAKGSSSNGNYVVTTRSRSNEKPVSILLNRKGKQIMKLEKADVFGLPKGWQMPEPIVAKAEDGRTDIYGVIFRPSDFDPKKTYPIVDITYSGATTPVGSFSNALGGGMAMYVGAAWAELGFIAVSIETRGGSVRDSNFSHYRDPRIPVASHNHNDRIAMLKQMVARYPYMDITRVGVGTPGSVTNALTALFAYPEFFKVGTSANAISDYRVFGVFAGRGNDGRKRIEEYAENLQGKLLLMHGMLDDVVSLASPMRIVDALQKADKPVDMLFLPNDGHTMSPDGMTYAWDYMLKHLMGVTPPREARLP